FGVTLGVTWTLGTPLGSLWGHSVVTLWSLCGHPVVTVVTLWSLCGHPVVTLWSLCGHCGHSVVTLWSLSVGVASVTSVLSPPARSAPSAPAAPPPAAGEGGGPPAPPPNLTSNRRLQQTQAQVDEVVDIMRVNVDKVLERDQKLSELDDRADALQAGASQFETSAAKLKRKYWWKNLKMMIILGVICAIVLIIIIVYFST
ncbi:vesicle-associated membrane protein 2, partial [Poecile atricapillus]